MVSPVKASSWYWLGCLRGCENFKGTWVVFCFVKKKGDKKLFLLKIAWLPDFCIEINRMYFLRKWHGGWNKIARNCVCWVVNYSFTPCAIVCVLLTRWHCDFLFFFWRAYVFGSRRWWRCIAQTGARREKIGLSTCFPLRTSKLSKRFIIIRCQSSQWRGIFIWMYFKKNASIEKEPPDYVKVSSATSGDLSAELIRVQRYDPILTSWQLS